MKFSALASGSSGNCFYVENEKREEGIIIDCGISCKKVEERMQEINRNAENIRAIFVTHEHVDHIRGIDVFARKFQIPIFTPKKIANNSFLTSETDLVKSIKNNETTKLLGMEINAFSKSHAGEEPVSYSVVEHNKKIAIMTDVGYCCPNIIENVNDSNFLLIESNYDEQMLEEGRYPWPTKQWIKGDTGHLSNLQSSTCVLEHASKKLNNIMLAHLSENNNTPQKALETYNYLMTQRIDIKPKINISLKMAATPLFKI